ncbi:hypothetical protein JCM8097_009445 [Rhodosporidiobolus ruineniae]
MRAFLAALVLPLLASSANAGGLIAGIAGTIDNAAEAASLQSVAKALSGSYIFKNAQTGHTLTYDPDGNDVVPSAGSGTPVNVLTYGGGTNWIRLQIGEKDKCLSSQWGGSYNKAGVMYACAVDGGGDVTRADNTLEPTKQWWIAVPVGDYDPSSDSSHSNGVLLAAQAESVATRAKAHAKGIIAHFDRRSHSHGHGTSLERRFELVQRAKKTRPHWKTADRSAAKHSPAEVRKKQQAAAKKAGSKAQTKAKKPASKVKTSSTSSKKKTASKKKTSSKKVAASPAKKTSTKKVSAASGKKASAAKKQASSGAASVAAGIRLNVASSSSSKSSRYFIIPVDHLIDMHTMALTGHEIASFNAQSTALDLFDPNDLAQQWILTPA